MPAFVGYVAGRTDQSLAGEAGGGACMGVTTRGEASGFER
jgi:hypothetical protein